MAAFPDGVRVFREKENLPGVVFDPNNKKTLYADDMIALEEEVRAVEATLLTPAGRRMPIVGTGFPNGVVSAPVGSKYIDTNATNGAIEWVKATGTGNTGWVVSVGDTGWRNISGSFDTSIVNSTTQRMVARIRRVGSIIEIMAEFSLLVNQSGEIAPFIDSALDANWRPDDLVWDRKPLVHPNGTGLAGYTKFSNNFRVKSTVINGIMVRETYTTRHGADAWPSTLPGTAV